MEHLPLKEAARERIESVKRRIGARILAGLEAFDDAHDIDWGIEDDEPLEIHENIILGED